MLSHPAQGVRDPFVVRLLEILPSHRGVHLDVLETWYHKESDANPSLRALIIIMFRCAMIAA